MLLEGLVGVGAFSLGILFVVFFIVLLTPPSGIGFVSPPITRRQRKQIARQAVWMWEPDDEGNPVAFYGWKVVDVAHRNGKLHQTITGPVSGRKAPFKAATMVCPVGQHDAPDLNCHGCGFHAYATLEQATRHVHEGAVLALVSFTGRVHTFADPPGLIGQHQQVVAIAVPPADEPCCLPEETCVYVPKDLYRMNRSGGLVTACNHYPVKGCRSTTLSQAARRLGVPVLPFDLAWDSRELPAPDPIPLPSRSDKQPVTINRKVGAA